MATIIILIFPIVFMFHEFEEIIGMKPWLSRNGKYLTEKFPFIRNPIERMGSLSSSGFAMAVFEEFLIVGIVTVLAVYYEWYYAWMAIFLAFSFHLLVHIAQWLIIRKYIPMIITSLLCLPYCIYAFIKIVELFSSRDILICFGAGVIFMVINLLFAHKLGVLFDKWIASTNVHSESNQCEG